MILFPVVRAGNQLVLTFADGPADPNRRLFVMYRTLDDISPLRIATPTQDNSGFNIQPDAQPKYTNANRDNNSTVIRIQKKSAEQAVVTDLAIRVALVPILLVLGGTMIIQVLTTQALTIITLGLTFKTLYRIKAFPSGKLHTSLS